MKVKRERSRGRPWLQAFAGAAIGVASCTHPLAAAAEDVLHPSLRACAALGDNAERLACYDRAVAELASGASAASPPPTPQEMFGMDAELSRSKEAEAGVKREQLEDITARVTALRASADGSLVVELDNGQTWQQLDSKKALVVRVGDTVKISRAALGAFRIMTSDQRTARVKRLR